MEIGVSSSAVALIRGIPFFGFDPVVEIGGISPYRSLDQLFSRKYKRLLVFREAGRGAAASRVLGQQNLLFAFVPFSAGDSAWVKMPMTFIHHSRFGGYDRQEGSNLLFFCSVGGRGGGT